jgi:hypothetical protein
VTLVLRAVRVDGPLRWRWLLIDEATGQPLADHEVVLDADAAEVRAFGDVYGWVRSYAAPVTVRVTAGFALRWPLELAHVGGVPLAARGDVPLVYGAGEGGDGPSVAGASLRMLAVFSQPTKTSVLALRRERYALTRLIRRIAAKQQRVVELAVVQYGVTRQRLAEIVDTEDGWDVLHLSGHGERGVFLLEHADGSPDPVDVPGLVDMLRPLRGRVKLAVVSACESAAAATAQTLRLIGLDEQAEQVEAGDAGPSQGSAVEGGAAEGSAVEGSAGVAAALVDALDCAVVAMRYPVRDEFAIEFGRMLYERVLGRRQPVDVAVARALKGASGVALATPGLFGARAAGLVLPVPRGTPRLDPDQTPAAYLPPEPVRFVGRAAARWPRTATGSGGCCAWCRDIRS